MTERVVVLMLGAAVSAAAPPGCAGADLAAAMAEDVFAVFSELDGVDEAIAFADPAGAELARSIAWPGTLLVEVASGADALREFSRRGYRQAALVAADAPDLPALHLAKVFSALDSAPAATALAVNGGAVIVASRLPPRPDLDGVDLDGPPHPGVRQTLPWRRLRRPADLALLDPGLEGWEATRALLTTGSNPAQP